MKILFDNYNKTSTCKSLWGFSAYFEKYQLLFDTGSNGRTLLHNMKELGVDIKDVKYLFITHAHWDHIGGIDSVLELNNQITMFVPSSLSKKLIIDLKTLAKDVVVCDKTPKKLFDGVFTTGILGKEMPEQSLILDDDYPKVITGCGHHGIENIVKVARDFLQKDIKMAVGGFHLLDKNDAEILKSIDVLKSLHVKKVAPTHCTGDRAIELYKEHFGSDYIAGGIGSIIPSL